MIGSILGVVVGLIVGVWFSGKIIRTINTELDQ
jgi:uncharacterized protein YneF (UPF0154 family)